MKQKTINKILSVITLCAVLVGNIGVASSAFGAVGDVTTSPASSITTIDVTLNGVNGPTDAIGHSFWVSTSTFSTASPTIPGGVFSTIDFGAIASSTAFSATLSSIVGLGPVTANTTYYFSAWSNIAGTWTPGEVLSFTTLPTPVTPNLNTQNNFLILSKTGITDTGSHTSALVGNIGTSAITSASIGVFCSEITGKIYGVDSAYVGSGDQTCYNGNPPLSNKTLVDNAVADMEIAYNDYAGMTNPTATELGAGNIGGMTLAPGLYKWSTDVSISTSVTLSGSATDIWVFQIAGDLNIAGSGSVASGIKVNLSGGAKASNIFWQVGGVTGATLGTYSTFNGTILTAKQIIIETGSVLNGRALAQTQVTLDAGVVIDPEIIVNVDPNVLLHVTSIDTVKRSATADGTFENGWKYVFHITAPLNEQKLSMKFSDWTNIADGSIIPTRNNMRISSLQADNNGTTTELTNANTYSSPEFNMTSDLDSGTIGRQVDVIVEVAVPVGSVNGSYTSDYGVKSVQ